MTNTTVEPRDLTSPAGAREHVPTIIIGAGQTGLATAYHLTRRGHRCLVLHEHTRVGDVWRRRYASLRLNTPARYDALPGMAFPAPGRTFPTGAEMGDYLEAYAERFCLEVRGLTRVTRVEQTDSGFVVTTSTGVLEADQVVVATGGEHHPRVPGLAERLDPGIRQVHSSDYRDPAQLLPGATLVVGAGQSGADLALEIAEAGHETWLSGTPAGEIPVELGSFKARLVAPVLFFMAHHVLTERTRKGRQLRERIRSGGAAPLLRVKLHHLAEAGVHHVPERTTDVVDGKPALGDGTVLDVANVVWCTGFRQDFSFIHPSPVGDDGWPRDEGGVMTDLPGLYFMGLLFQRGFYSMLVGGAGRDAEHIARQILARDRVNARSAA
jgi:putative flavoprotein involved in K+ transport